MTPPPRATSSRPASNCGLTSATIIADGVSNSMVVGRILRREIKEQSATAREGVGWFGGKFPGVR